MFDLNTIHFVKPKRVKNYLDLISIHIPYNKVENNFILNTRVNILSPKKTNLFKKCFQFFLQAKVYTFKEKEIKTYIKYAFKLPANNIGLRYFCLNNIKNYKIISCY